MERPFVSIVTPVYNECENIDILYGEIERVMNGLEGVDWEFIPVDDKSKDGSIDKIRELARSNDKVRYIRLAKNEGSHIAIFAGLMHARGNCVIVMASDLQDPVDEIPRMIRHWKTGYHIVWMVRDQDEGYRPGLFGSVWYKIVKRLPGLSSMPSTGSDMFLLDSKVRMSLVNQNVKKVAITLLLRSLGFRQINLLYTKNARVHGVSSWTLWQKIRHILNTVMAFTNIPIRLITILGFSFSGIAFCYSLFLLIHRLIIDEPVSGWHSLMVFIAFSSSLSMLLMGILSEYIWRIFENSRQSPMFLVEESSEDIEDDGGSRF